MFLSQNAQEEEEKITGEKANRNFESATIQAWLVLHSDLHLEIKIAKPERCYLQDVDSREDIQFQLCLAMAMYVTKISS